MPVQDKARADACVSEVCPPPATHPLQESERRSAALVTVDATVPRGLGGCLAHVISQVGSPPVLTTTAIALNASVLSSPRAWVWAGLHVLLAILTPLLYLVWLVYRGRVADLDVRLRQQRVKPMIFALVCAGLAWLALALGAAPRPTTALAGVLWVQAATIFAVTLRWKVSVHCTAAAGAATVVWLLMGTPLPLLVGVPLVAWSRVRLHRHTLSQTVVGTLLGLAVFLPIAGGI